MDNWYVIQVRTGSENKICNLCRQMVSKDVLKECFIPVYERKMKVRGEWIITSKILFPGYLFIITDQIELLYQNLKKVPAFTKILGTEDCLIALYEKEVDFLMRFYEQDKTLKMSYGYIAGDRVVITDGVLQGLEGCIGKIDRHKRIAELNMDFFGRKTKVEVGLEIVKKYENNN